MVPATLLYLLHGGARRTRCPIPFVELGFAASGLWLLHFAAIGFPLSMVETLFRSESFAGVLDLLYAAPADRDETRGEFAGICVTCCSSSPRYMLVFLAAIFAWSFGNLWHAAAHTLVVLALIAHIAIQMLLLVALRACRSRSLPKQGQPDGRPRGDDRGGHGNRRSSCPLTLWVGVFQLGSSHVAFLAVLALAGGPDAAHAVRKGYAVAGWRGWNSRGEDCDRDELRS